MQYITADAEDIDASLGLIDTDPESEIEDEGEVIDSDAEQEAAGRLKRLHPPHCASRDAVAAICFDRPAHVRCESSKCRSRKASPMLTAYGTIPQGLNDSGTLTSPTGMLHLRTM